MVLDKFLRFGERVFSGGDWHRVPFQPIILLMLWGAALRIVWDNTVPAPFQQTLSDGGESAWLTLVLVCPPLSLLAWWLIMHSSWARSSLIGLWLRLAADIGICTAVTVFHIADALDRYRAGVEEPAAFLSRYITASVMLFAMLLVIRDVWALVLTSRLARVLQEQR